jgi:hypothetical protein
LRKIREILRLKEEAGLSNRAIARACKISNSTVGEYPRRARLAGVGWPIPEGESEDELLQKLFPDTKRGNIPNRPFPDWEEIRQELKKKGAMLHFTVRFDRISHHSRKIQWINANYPFTYLLYCSLSKINI